MAEGLNKAILVGNLGMDPELKFTQGGQAVLRIRLATTESYPSKTGERQERTEWHTVVVWGKRAEALNKILSKGSRIFIEGGLRTSSYEREGQKRYKTEVVANEIILAGGARGGGGPRSGDDYGGPGGDDAPPAGGGGYSDGDYGGGGEDDIPF